jgi:DNA adenine methylase
MTDNEHRALAETLHKVKGKVALSGYHCKLLDELYSDWTYIESPAKKAHSTNTRPDNTKQDRVETLWINYSLPENQNGKGRTAWQTPEKFSKTLFDEPELA